jgi:hypothetical protein
MRDLFGVNKEALRLYKVPKTPSKMGGWLPSYTALSLFNRNVVRTVFDVSENISSGSEVIDWRIFNMDGTSHIVLRVSKKITAQKGKHRVGDISHCEQGETVIVSHAVSAIGLSVLPVFVHRKRIKNSLPRKLL